MAQKDWKYKPENISLLTSAKEPVWINKKNGNRVEIFEDHNGEYSVSVPNNKYYADNKRDALRWAKAYMRTH